MSETVNLLLPDGATVRAEVTVTGEEEVAFRAFDFAAVTAAVKGIAASVRESVQPLMPDKIAVEFGLELAVENGGLVAIVAKGSAKANFTIALEWTRAKAAGESSDEP